MTDINQPRAFTIEHKGVIDRLKTECGICKEYDPNFEQEAIPLPIHNCKALWDTGASKSVISANVVQALNLESFGKTLVFHADGESMLNLYYVNIVLPNNLGSYTVKVTEGKLTGMDVLIGMDIISQGDFSITSSKGKTKFSFQVPSTHDIDYEKECKRKISK